MSMNNGELMISILGDDTHKKIISMIESVDKDSEFEVMFSNYKKGSSINIKKFLSILEYLKNISNVQKKEIINSKMLDIIYAQSNELVYRISIDGSKDINTINKIMKRVSDKINSMMFRILTVNFKENKYAELSLIKKTKEFDDKIDVDDIDVRFRKSSELKLNNEEIETLSKLPHSDANKIIFRLKDRLSIYLYEDEKFKIRCDLTSIKQNVNFNRLNATHPKYELELEIECKKGYKKFLTPLYDNIIKLTKVLQQSNFVITKSQSENVLKYYCGIIGADPSTITQLSVRQPESIELINVTDRIMNKYAVTDKADGERFNLIIFDSKVYLISNNLDVIKFTGIELKKKLAEKYNGTIMDGEYIYIAKANNYAFMIFDCMFNGPTDIRKIVKLLDRHKIAEQIVNECFIFDGQNGYIPDDYGDGISNIGKLLEYHSKQIDKFYDGVNNDIMVKKTFPLIRKKYFIGVNGVMDNEIFKFSDLIWTKYLNKNKFPYMLDGLIYHPLEQDYNVSAKESKNPEYKWKPQNKNSIDFYIRFLKNPMTGMDYIAFDNTFSYEQDEYQDVKTYDPSVIRERHPYKICHLHVGRWSREGEEPVLFQEETNGYIAYLYLEDGEVRDREGNIIQDGTVVEFCYDMTDKRDAKYRWIPLKSRYDKTESVILYGKKYGNSFNTANKVWRSIVNPVTEVDISQLANDKIFVQHLKILKSKLSHEQIVAATKEDAYFQIRKDINKPMRHFHNYIKSIMIFTMCSGKYHTGKEKRKLSVLDLGIGEGQDIGKFYHAEIDHLVGVDLDYNGLYGDAKNSAFGRYNDQRSKRPGFPPMHFIQADITTKLRYDDQIKIIDAMTPENKKLLMKYFPNDDKKITQFDRINCQLAIHYAFKDDTTWENFKYNLNRFLKPGGYFLVTTFDAKIVLSKFVDDKIISHYTDEKGKKNVLFEVIKKFKDTPKGKIGTGYPIDVYNAWFMSEGEHYTEYLVDPDFIVSELQKDCNMDLVDTSPFSNIYEMHRDFVTKISKQMTTNVKTMNYISKDVASYYVKNEINEASFKNTELFRYYIFRKNDENMQIGGNKGDLLKENDYSIDRIDVEEYSFLQALNHILTEGKYKPETKLKVFTKQFNIKLLKDELIDTNYIKELCNKINIEHEDEDEKTENVLDGISVIVLEKDCDDVYNSIIYKGGKKMKNNIAMVLNEGGKYYPIHRNDKYVFSKKDKNVQDIISETN